LCEPFRNRSVAPLEKYLQKPNRKQTKMLKRKPLLTNAFYEEEQDGLS
jgi:hypothetical protein